MKAYRVAIVGATGMVGQEFIKVLEQRNFPVESLDLLASDRSAGKKLYFNHREIEVKETTPESFKGIDIALFSAGADISRYFAPLAVQAGAAVVDNSSAWRMDPKVPLVVPEINVEDIKKHKGIIANPNCSTIQMVVPLYPLHKTNPIKRIIASTYQSVSGTGIAAMDELTNQTKQVLNGQTVVPHVYSHQIAFNVAGNRRFRITYAKKMENGGRNRKVHMIISPCRPQVCVQSLSGIAKRSPSIYKFDIAEARRILSMPVKLMDDAISLYPSLLGGRNR